MSISSVVHVAPQFFGPDAVICSPLDPYNTNLDLGMVKIGDSHRAVMRVAFRLNVPGLKPDILNETRMFIEVSPTIPGLTASVSKYGHAAVREFPDSTVLQLLQVFQIEVRWAPDDIVLSGIHPTISLRLAYTDRMETLFRFTVDGTTEGSLA